MNGIRVDICAKTMLNELPDRTGKTKFGTVCVTDLDKPSLVKLCYSGVVLGLSQILQLPQLPQK